MFVRGLLDVVHELQPSFPELPELPKVQLESKHAIAADSERWISSADADG